MNKYGKDFIYKTAETPNNMSLMFKDIWSCSEICVLGPFLSNKMFKRKVCYGNKINFWKDFWTYYDALRSSYKRLFSLANDKDISQSDMKVLWQ